MPVLIQGNPIPKVYKNPRKWHKLYPTIKNASELLLSQDVKVCGPQKLLYVIQREYAVTDPTDNVIDVIGSEDATTCHIIIIRHTGSGVTALAHLDGCETDAGIDTMISQVKSLSTDKPTGRLEVHLTGGFKDDDNTSSDLTKEIMDKLHSLQDDIHLVTMCVSDGNDTVRNGIHFPVIYGMAINVKTGEIFRASFPDHGPAMSLRSARHFSDCNEVLNVYDRSSNQLTVGPYVYSVPKNVEFWISAPEGTILRYLSTSPEQEPSDYVQNIRDTFTFIKDNPDPDKVFNGQPFKYQKQADGSWTKMA